MNNQTNATILLVEDSPTLAHVYGAYLSKENWNVKLAETGAKAVEILHRCLPQVMVLDLKLPDMDGLDILHQVVEEKNPLRSRGGHRPRFGACGGGGDARRGF